MASSSTRRRFTREFKLDVIAQSQTCASIVGLARDLGIRPELIYRWRTEFTQDPARSFSGNGIPQESATEAELTRLQRDNARLRQERDILKKALGICSTPPM